MQWQVRNSKYGEYYENYSEYYVHTISRSGEIKKRPKSAYLTLQVSNINLSYDTVNVLCPRHNRKESQSSYTHLVSKKVTLHSLVLLRLPWGILGLPLSLIVAQPTWDGLTGFLLRMGPSWTSHYTHWSFKDGVLLRLVAQPPSWNSKSLNMQVLQDLTANYVSQSWMSHSAFLGRVLPTHAITGATTKSMSVHYSTVGQSASYQKVDWLLAVSQQKQVASEFDISSQTLGSQPLAVGSWSSCCTGSTGADEPNKVFNYHGPHIGHQVLSWVFFSYFLRDAQALAPCR